MKCSVKTDGNAGFFDVGGKTVVPSAYMSYNPTPENIDALKKAGVNTFMFPIYAGDEGINMESGLRPFCDNFFKGYGKYDFSAVEKVLNMIGDGDVYVIPRVCLEPPKWWQKLNPDELSRDFRGEAQRESFTSEKWRTDMTVALRALIDYFDSSKWRDKIIGIHVAAGGTEEWTYHGRYARQYYDYSECNRRAYVSWLRRKYGTEEALSLAWGRKIETFDSVTFPKPVERSYAKSGFLRDPVDERAVLDYYDFHNEAVADTINYFCREVKEYTDGEKITGVFYGYVFSMPQSYKGLHALRRVFESPHVDFVSTTNIGMEAGEAWVFSSAVESARLAGKLWMAEGDIRTHLTRGLDVSMPHAAPDNDFYSSSVWSGPKTPELSASALTKALARITTSGCGIWWFDMFGGWLNDAALLDIISKTEGLISDNKKPYLKSDVAVIIDETGYKYYGFDTGKMTDAVREVGRNLAHAGVAYDIYLQSDLKNPAFAPDNYKLYIFLAGVAPSEEDKRAIEERLKGGGRTLLWLHSAAFYDSDLCGFKLAKSENRLPRRAVYKDDTYPKYPLETFKFESGGGYVLSRFEDGEAAVIWRDMGDYASVYSLILAPSPELLRDVALMSGAHIYSYNDDCVFAGGEYLAIHACEDGYRRLNLPGGDFEAKNAVTGEPISVNDMFIDLKMKKYETVLIKLSKAE